MNRETYHQATKLIADINAYTYVLTMWENSLMGLFDDLYGGADLPVAPRAAAFRVAKQAAIAELSTELNALKQKFEAL